ncbi:MAG: decarboxylating 6-phosphogluconate dehydrogenase [Gammaproteobacteria bacterium]
MQLGMIGLGRMGANMVRRLQRGGHQCVAFDRSPDVAKDISNDGARGTTSLAEFVKLLDAPRVIWVMVPAAAVDTVIADLKPMLQAGDIIIDGGNSHYHDDIRRARELKASGIHYMDVGTSGGVLGLERGYCLMAGGESADFAHVDPIFATLAPGGEGSGTAARGYLHCGNHGAGHFVKMVHNGIEYGLMAAYAEGFNILRHADAGLGNRAADAETAPLSNPDHFKYQLDIAAVAELWRHGSIIGSSLLDLTAFALAKDPELQSFAGSVADSGEGRWTLQAAIEEGVPAYVLSAALYSRFASRDRGEYADKLLSAMRLGFGGHQEGPHKS